MLSRYAFQLVRISLTAASVAFELWTISDGIAFDNVLITDDVDVAKHISSVTYQIKKEMSDSETDNIIVKAVKYTNKYPWLWAVYLLAVGIPVVLFIAFCCVTPVKRYESSKSTTEPKAGVSGSAAQSDRIAQTKKTDESVPDDIQEEEEPPQLEVWLPIGIPLLIKSLCS